MAKLSDEQILAARSVDLLSWLVAHEPASLKKCGINEYCLAEHDSLKISNGKFHWFSRGVGGSGALDFLVKVRGVDFVTAVQSLTDRTAITSYQEKPVPKINSPPKTAKPFALPPASVNNDRVYAYLRGRSIGKDIINRCIKSGILYESKAHRCVFVGMDNGVPRSAFERELNGPYKRDAAGSDKRYGFCFPPLTGDENSRLALFESAIDAMAHFEIQRIGQTGWDGYRLSLGGVGSACAVADFTVSGDSLIGVDAEEGAVHGSADDVGEAHVGYFELRGRGEEGHERGSEKINRFTLHEKRERVGNGSRYTHCCHGFCKTECNRHRDGRSTFVMKTFAL